MSAFDPIGSGIDRTLPGQPHVVDSDGWGWGMLLLFLALPFVYLTAVVIRFASFFASHAVPCLLVYLVFSFLIGRVLYRSKANRHRVLGLLAAMLTMLPMGLIVTFYTVPFAVLEPGFTSAFDFIILLLLCFGGEVLIFSLSRLLKNGRTHFSMSIAFLLLGLLLLEACLISEQELLTPDSIRSVYRI